ncbi:MAG: hypothetical protein OXF85_01730 [Candidatus Saccharibacteria bacterium]|nr:hypothetical protein [Candidatus Saccharibacteria bacterium]MCY4010560.1 hypothetical protein [Candidatus Saccharibacteria bacterium]MCY4088847.1 hypothetical protein [Candidatus Saccharibacteria bacterium]
MNLNNQKSAVDLPDELDVATEDSNTEDSISPLAGIKPDTDKTFDRIVSNSETPKNQELSNLKQKALEQLVPLVDNLEQSPDQYFRTLMMIIQETGNTTMLDRAYETVLKFDDDKERAQALLTIANEISYLMSK